MHVFSDEIGYTKFVPYISLSDMLVLLRKTLERRIEKSAYVSVYWPHLDGISHFSGPYSEEALAELRVFSRSFEEEFIRKISPKVADFAQ